MRKQQDLYIDFLGFDNVFERLTFQAPVSLNDMSDLMMPKTSAERRVCTLPVFGSGFSSSSVLPHDTTCVERIKRVLNKHHSILIK